MSDVARLSPYLVVSRTLLRNASAAGCILKGTKDTTFELRENLLMPLYQIGVDRYPHLTYEFVCSRVLR